MNRQIKTGSYNLESVPRVGGDEPEMMGRDFLVRGVFPAWAGMNRGIRGYQALGHG